MCPLRTLAWGVLNSGMQGEHDLQGQLSPPSQLGGTKHSSRHYLYDIVMGMLFMVIGTNLILKQNEANCRING